MVSVKESAGGGVAPVGFVKLSVKVSGPSASESFVTLMKRNFCDSLGPKCSVPAAGV